MAPWELKHIATLYINPIKTYFNWLSCLTGTKTNIIYISVFMIKFCDSYCIFKCSTCGWMSWTISITSLCHTIFELGKPIISFSSAIVSSPKASSACTLFFIICHILIKHELAKRHNIQSHFIRCYFWVTQATELNSKWLSWFYSASNWQRSFVLTAVASYCG
jgi:hypothetical protein